MEGVTFNGEPLEKTRYGVDDSLGRSVVRAPRSVRASSDRRRDLGASRARHNRDDDKVWMDRRWDR